jgi:hypothetical protein
MKRRKEPTVPVCLRLPETLYNELRVLLCDPRTGTPRFGTWGHTLETALREWLDRQKVAPQ